MTSETQVARRVDYWDGSAFDAAIYQKLRVPPEAFPRDFQESGVGQAVAPAMLTAAQASRTALAQNKAAAAAALFSYDGVYEDMTARTQVLGRSAIERYLARALPTAPFAAGTTLRHIVGGAEGGGFEWVGVAGQSMPGGITAIKLDAAGKITRATTVHDGRLLSQDVRAALALAALEP